MTPPFREKSRLSILTDPNIAFILILVGVYGLIFEFANPGTIGPGVVGVICLLLGLYALNVLPLNYAGLGLLLFSIALMAAEAFVPSFGILGIGGIVSFVLGAVILFDSDVPGFGLSWTVIGVTAGLSAGPADLPSGLCLESPAKGDNHRAGRIGRERGAGPGMVRRQGLCANPR